MAAGGLSKRGASASTALLLLVTAPQVRGVTAVTSPRPFCIGVAGATASGKSSVVSEIVRLLDAEGRVASVTQDCFYKNLSPSEREEAYNSNYNFDHPNAFDWPQQLDVMTQLRSGADNVPVPAYDFVTQCVRRSTQATMRVPEL